MRTRVFEGLRQDIRIESEMTIVSRSKDSLEEVCLEVIFVAILVILHVLPDRRQVSKDVVARVIVVARRISLVARVTLPFQVGLNGIDKIESGLLSKRNRLLASISQGSGDGGCGYVTATVLVWYLAALVFRGDLGCMNLR